MFLYYLIDLREQPHSSAVNSKGFKGGLDPPPRICELYFDDHAHSSKEDLIKKYFPGGITEKESSQIVYSRVPLTEICGINDLCNDADEKNIYFFHLGDYEFYYSIGKTLEQSLTCLDIDINPERWELIEKIVKNNQYDYFSLDQIELGTACCGLRSNVIF